MRPARLFSPLLALLLLAVPTVAVGAAPAAAAGATYSSEVTMAMPGLVVVDRAFVITGQVVVTGTGDPEDTGALSEAEVELWRRWAGQERWVQVATATTTADSTPSYTFRRTAERNAGWRVVYAGSEPDLLEDPFAPTVAGSESAREQRVMRDLNAGSVVEGGAVYLRGNVDPGWGERVVSLQRKTCGRCAWEVYDRQRTSGTGRFRFRTPAPPDGSWFYRARIPAAGWFTTSYSGVLRTWRS